MNIFAISSPVFFDNETHIVNHLLAAGLPRLHLRKPDANAQQMEDYVAQIEPQYHSRLVLHSAHDLCRRFAVGGLHFKHSNVKLAQSFKTNNLPLSYSAHSIAEVSRLSAMFDYFFISPVFDSISKQGYYSAFNINDLREFINKQSQIKLVALGGVSPENVLQLTATGFWAAAVMGYLWGNSPTTDNLPLIEQRLHQLTS